MDIKRYGVDGGVGTGGQHLPFARAVEANGWLYVSGQVPMANGELIPGNITTQSRQAIQNLLSILEEAGYGPKHVVRCGVWLEDSRDFASFNASLRNTSATIHRLALASSPTWLSIAKWRSTASLTKLRTARIKRPAPEADAMRQCGQWPLPGRRSASDPAALRHGPLPEHSATAPRPARTRPQHEWPYPD
jgi:enamine deaminase RidA (YjgF/YER057c/UK114 family)